MKVTRLRLTIQKWGNSLALRLPKALAKDLGLEAGSAVEVRSDGNEITIRRAAVKCALEDMVLQISESNRHSEIEVKPVRGKEAW